MAQMLVQGLMKMTGDFKPELADLRSEWADQRPGAGRTDLRSERADGRPDMRPERPERPTLRLQRPDLRPVGGTDKLKHRRT